MSSQITEPEVRTTAKSEARRPVQRGAKLQRYGLVLVWAAVVVVFGVVEPDTFLTGSNWASILGSQALLVVLTLGLIVPMTCGDFDLSVASTVGLSAMLVAVLNTQHGVSVGLAVLAALAAGAVIGTVNGVIVTYFGIDAIIVTLGSGTFISGITLWISGGNVLSGVSQSLVNLVLVDQLFGISLSFYFGLLACVCVWWVFEFTPVGRRLLVVGRGRNVARLSGLHVDRLRVGALAASGTMAAMAGVLFVGTTSGADPSSSAQFLLPAFAAAFLGATTIQPGRFNPWGAFTAVYFLVTGINGLQLLGVQTYVQNLFYGGALVIAVAASQLTRRRQEMRAGAG